MDVMASKEVRDGPGESSLMSFPEANSNCREVHEFTGPNFSYIVNIFFNFYQLGNFTH